MQTALIAPEVPIIKANLVLSKQLLPILLQAPSPIAKNQGILASCGQRRANFGRKTLSGSSLILGSCENSKGRLLIISLSQTQLS